MHIVKRKLATVRNFDFFSKSSKNNFENDESINITKKPSHNNPTHIYLFGEFLPNNIMTIK